MKNDSSATVSQTNPKKEQKDWKNEEQNCIIY